MHIFGAKETTHAAFSFGRMDAECFLHLHNTYSILCFLLSCRVPVVLAFVADAFTQISQNDCMHYILHLAIMLHVMHFKSQIISYADFQESQHCIEFIFMYQIRPRTWINALKFGPLYAHLLLARFRSAGTFAAFEGHENTDFACV